MAEYIRISVVERPADSYTSAGRIKNGSRRKSAKEIKNTSNANKSFNQRLRGKLVIASVASRQIAQISTSFIGVSLDQRYAMASSQASISGNTRQGQILAQQHQVSKSRLSTSANFANFGLSSVAAFAINPILGASMAASYAIQTGITLSATHAQYMEELRQYAIKLQKEIYESDYKRTRLNMNTYTNRGVGR